jgi:hypothetical protein
MKNQSILKSVTMTCTEGTNNQKAMERMQNMDAWTVTLKFEKRQMSIPFFQGYGHNGKEPELKSVLSSLVSDWNCGKDDFEDFCSNLGYDQDSRKAESTWKACRASGTKLEKLFGDKLELIESAVEDY